MSWIVRMAAPDEATAVEVLTARLWDLGSTGVAEIGPPVADGPQVLAGFDDEATARRVADEFAGTVESAVTEVAEPPPSLVRLAGPPSVVVGHPARLDDAATSAEITVVIEAGPTFGHGAHPTTHLALEAVLALAAELPGVSVLDLGAGSGVLGVLAARLGARVTATEIDPDAHTWIRTNAAANGVTIELRPTDLTGHEPVDVALVNVLLPVHRAVAADVVRLTRGAVVVTGVRDDQVDEVLGLYGRPVIDDRSQDGWRLLVFAGVDT